MAELISLNCDTTADEILCFSCAGFTGSSCRQRSKVKAEQHNEWTVSFSLCLRTPTSHIDPYHALYPLCVRHWPLWIPLPGFPCPLASIWVWPKGDNNRVLGGERRSILGYLLPLHLYLCLARVVAVVVFYSYSFGPSVPLLWSQTFSRFWKTLFPFLSFWMWSSDDPPHLLTIRECFTKPCPYFFHGALSVTVFVFAIPLLPVQQCTMEGRKNLRGTR